MSIQALNKSLFTYKLADVGILLKQIVAREINFKDPGVFFRYKTSLTHPTFDRFFEDGPVPWSNYHRASMAHWINYPAIITKIPFLLECSDHPLSAVGFSARGLHEPAEILKHVERAAEIYELPQCRVIAVPCAGFKNLFEQYFGAELCKKFVDLHSPGCIPKVTEIKTQPPLTFICLASDYELKGVDLLISAWLGINEKSGARLVIACPNVPDHVVKSAEAAITFILKAPLTNREKHQLLAASAVSIGSTHVHGGGNLFEGMEYGHAIIHFSTHTTFFRAVGEEIAVPYHFYLPSRYGIQWKTFSEFRATLREDKRQGVFAQTVRDLASAMRRYIDNPEALHRDRVRVLSAAEGWASLESRNAKLRKIYFEILNDM